MNFKSSFISNTMKSYIFVIVSVLLFSCNLHAQAAPSTADQINSLWMQKKYDDLETLLNAKVALTPPDVVALCSAKIFFVLVKPNKAKALESVNKLKQLADNTHNSDLIAYAAGEVAQMQTAPAGELKIPSAATLEKLHSTFPDKYPNIDFALKVEKGFTTP
jgi:hypothetical protein